MTWNHRVIRKVHARVDGEDDVSFGIHEVYYEGGVPTMCTMDAVGVCSDTAEGLVEILNWMRKGLASPVLEYADFKEGGKYYEKDEDCIDLDSFDDLVLDETPD